MWNWYIKAYHTADNQQEGMHADTGQHQPRGVLEAEKKNWSWRTEPAQTDVGKCTKIQ